MSFYKCKSNGTKYNNKLDYLKNIKFNFCLIYELLLIINKKFYYYYNLKY